MAATITRKVVGTINIILGFLAIGLQNATYVLNDNQYAADVASSGIWGGLFLIITAIYCFTSYRSPSFVIAMKVTAILSVIGGVVMIGLYSWRIHQIENRWQLFKGGCHSRVSDPFNLGISISLENVCDQIAIASLFVVDGILAAIVNTILLFT